MHSKYLAHSTLCLALLAILAGCGDDRGSAPMAKKQSDAPAAPPFSVPAEPAASAPSADSKTMERARNETAAKDILKKEVERTRPNAVTAPEPASSVDNAAKMTSSAAMPAYTEGERKFMRTARANFQVKDVYQSALAIEDAVASHGGFVVKNDIGAEVRKKQRHLLGDDRLIELVEYSVRGELTVRVPSEKTQEFLRAIVGQIVFLDQRNFAAYDAQFDLLRQQLDYRRNQESQEELGRLAKEPGHITQKTDLQMMRTDSKAARDQALVQRREFEDKVAFSTIHLSIYQLPNVRQSEIVDADAVFRNHRTPFGTRIGKAVGMGWDSVLDGVVGLVKNWPSWLMLLLVGLGVVWGWRKAKATGSH